MKYDNGSQKSKSILQAVTDGLQGMEGVMMVLSQDNEEERAAKGSHLSSLNYPWKLNPLLPENLVRKKNNWVRSQGTGLLPPGFRFLFEEPPSKRKGTSAVQTLLVCQALC